MSTPSFIPGPAGLHAFQTLLNYYRDPLKTFRKLREVYGDIYQIKFWKYRVIHLTHPGDIHLVLQNPGFEMTRAFDAADPVVGKGLSTNTGEDWLRQRRMIQPAFHQEKISQYLQAITVDTREMLERWEADARQNIAFDLQKALAALNHAQLYRLLFGDEISPANQEILDALNFARNYTVQQANMLITVPRVWPTPNNRRFWRAVRLLDQFTEELIEQRRNFPDQHDDILTFMIQARDKTGEGMTDQQLHDEILTLFFAAYEDAANAVTWAFHEISRSPPVEQRLFEQVDKFVGDQMNFETLQQLPFVSQIVDETLRLYPPTWSLLRDVRDPVELRGFHLPKGAIVLINIFLLHRHPDYWPEPDRFNPEHFSAERAEMTRKPAYIPFGSGYRKCIGYALALAQMRANLAMIAKKFRIVPVSGQSAHLETGASLKMKGGYFVRLIPR